MFYFECSCVSAAAAAKEAARQAPATAAASGQPTKYVPPSLRGGPDGTQRRGETMQTRRSEFFIISLFPIFSQADHQSQVIISYSYEFA